MQRREVKKIAKSRPAEHGLPFSTWSLPKLAEFLVAEGVVDDISHEGLRMLFREEGVTFQRLKTWKASKDPEHAVKKARVEHLYAIADREVVPEPGEPEVMFCVDEFGPLNLQIARHVVRLAKILALPTSSRYTTVGSDVKGMIVNSRPPATVEPSLSGII